MEIISLCRFSNMFGDFRFISCTIENNDVMSLSLHDNGCIRFSRTSGAICIPSNPCGPHFEAMLAKVKEID